ncbi:MAG: MBL fold metallo-hydrolase [Muribaculaceae bacterium]|nr:MBL fold metallo-hydrolase [Muribaculaceae bacterium]
MALKHNRIDYNLFTGSLFDAALPVHPSIERAAEAARREREQRLTSELSEPMDNRGAVAPLRFVSFGSGSSGNSSYIGTRSAGVIIDAGVDLPHVVEGMEANGMTMDAVKGILITHDHGDHVRYVYTLARRYPHIGVYCTPRCFNGIMRRHNISRRLKDFHHPIYKEHPFNIAGLEITAFDVSHDGTDNAGFYITRAADGTRFAIATDLGCITDRVEHYMRLARFVVLESNYDSHMLDIGPYPDYLKARIRAACGHLDNVVTADFLRRIWSPEMTHVFLCHLSHDNNTPEIALATVGKALADIGIDCTGEIRPAGGDGRPALCLVALPRHEASPLYFLR